MSSPFDPRQARNTTRYKQERDHFMSSNPLCAECRKRGIVILAQELDHIVPVHRAPEKFWTKANWQALCKPCHEAKTRQEKMKREQAKISPEALKWRQDPMKFD